jgi:hypothetical protein
MFRKILRSQRGSVYAEYAVGIGMLIAVFVAAGLVLHQIARARANSSMGVVSTETKPGTPTPAGVGPCGPNSVLNAAAGECS